MPTQAFTEFDSGSPKRASEFDSKADIGIALDGDADRLVLVDETGEVIDGDQILATIAESWQREGRLSGGGIVATVMSNLGLERYLEGLNLGLARTPVGDRDDLRSAGMVDQLRPAAADRGELASHQPGADDADPDGGGRRHAVAARISLAFAASAPSWSMAMSAKVQSFFDPITSTVSYVIHAGSGTSCASALVGNR